MTNQIAPTAPRRSSSSDPPVELRPIEQADRMATSTHVELADALTGAVVLPGDPDWDEARSGFNLLGDQHPEAVAFPVDASDVAAAVAYGRRAGMRVAPQATGHNQDPLGDLDGTLLLNVSRLQEVRVDPGARQVRVGAGVKWDRVAPRLSAHGLAGLHGSSPDVGIAGYSLGGGMGWLARKHGLQTNAVTALELVTAEGTLVRADHEHHADLFWALRGGGGNFGVVTSIEFAVHPVDELYAGALFFPFERADEVLHAWSALQGGLPDELMSWASLLHFPPIPDVPAFARGRSFAVVMAAFLGSEAEGQALLRPLHDLAPVRNSFATVPPVVLGDLAMDPLDPLPGHSGHALLDGLPAEAVDAILAAVGPGSGRGETLTMLQFRQMGGALAREAPGAGARATLPGEISMYTVGVVPDEASEAEVRAAVAAVETALEPHRGPLPELRRGAGRRQHVLRPRDVAPPSRGEGDLRPGRPVQGQPPHPAGRRRPRARRRRVRKRNHDGHPDRATRPAAGHRAGRPRRGRPHRLRGVRRHP